ncbi:MAG TPA: diguanylate cyclase, partial [Permianibacter sp.]|nr:diguanylate cyclase [Permianibacter sp.]
IKRVHRAVAKPLLFGTDTLTVGTSIGVAAYPTDGDDLDALLSAADHAMYAGKNHGLTPSL